MSMREVVTKGKARVSRSEWGTHEGQEVFLYRLESAHGLVATISNFGGTIVSLLVPDRVGDFADIVLGHNTLAEYQTGRSFFGATIGRYANRIAEGKFTLNGKIYQTTINEKLGDRSCTLHGGNLGFDKRVWQSHGFVQNNISGLRLTLTSNDGDQGFPGRLRIAVTFLLRPDNRLTIISQAVCDQPTVINITNHSYFNLRGEAAGSVLDHILQIKSGKITEMGPGFIPTGNLLPVDATPFDFRKPAALGQGLDSSHPQYQQAGGYDHNFVLSESPVTKVKRVARLWDKKSGRVMHVATNEPGIQLYTSNFLDGSLIGKSGVAYAKHSSVCLETQHFPDSPNQPAFPSTVLLPGRRFHSATEFIFSTL
ncbi:MAG: galactose mutarotase [Fimbriimonadaceae bacterium]|jgi:aldose 1-epimerase|nr:galactose mutarotase [Fimbriimonadaceae bacterium]